MVPPSKYTRPETVLNWKDGRLVIIDVRSPSEFLEDHIPGAVNLPVLSDDERSRVGTLYKENNFEAKKLGARLISKNISVILEFLDDLDAENKSSSQSKSETSFVIYCWRGGMRSTSLYTVMDLIGYRTFILNGGYKAYRQWVNDYLKNLKLQNVLVLHGPSGTGKTKILEQLKDVKIFPINLEKFANHNGSVFGGRDSGQPSQKFFETNLVKKLLEADRSGLFIFEGESRKIGKLNLPETLNSILLQAKRIWIELPLAKRAEYIASEYQFTEEEFKTKLKYLRRNIPSEIIKEIESLFIGREFENVASLLLEYHYDPLYKKAFKFKKHSDEDIIFGNTRDYLLEKIRLYIRENYFA